MSEREGAVRRAAERWKQQLVDVSGLNRLLNYRDLKVGTLALTPCGEGELSLQSLKSLLEGKTVHMTGLFPGEQSQG